MNKYMSSVFTWVSDTLKEKLNEVMNHFKVGTMYVASDGKKVTIKLPRDPFEAIHAEAENYSFLIEIYINKQRETCFKAAETKESLTDSKEIIMLSVSNSKDSEITLEKVINNQLEIATSATLPKKEESNKDSEE